jgi:glycosyltransferase involved in cell wall biosynthesis
MDAEREPLARGAQPDYARHPTRMNPSAELTICVPVYNEATAITGVLRDLRDAFSNAEIIVVEDGSTDGTRELLKDIAGIPVIYHERNRGYGASIKSALRKASGTYFAWFDGDGQHRVEDLEKVVTTLIENDVDACIGMRGRDSDVPLRRIPGKWLLTFFAERIAGQAIPDLNSGLRCFRSSVLKRYVHLLPDGFSASTTSTMLMIKRQYRLQWVEITARKRSGRSSVRIIRDGFQGLALLLRIFVLFESLRFFFILSAIQVIPAAIYGSWRALTHRLGFPTFAAMVMISGILTFFMGIVCDQITALRKERFE